MRVLVIEDESIVLKAIQFKLTKEGYDVLVAEDGKQGIEKIETEKPDIIISDIMMPFVNGIEVISHVRNKLNSKTPIIILSAIGQEETVVKALELGANDYIIKPFSPVELTLRIKKLTIQYS